MIYAIIYVLILMLCIIASGIYSKATRRIIDDDLLLFSFASFIWPLVLITLIIYGVCFCLFKFGSWLWTKIE